MTSVTRRSIYGRDLRYLLTWMLVERGPLAVGRLVELAEADGFDLGPRASKRVSDALRWEIAHGRVVRLGWGRYGLGKIPATSRRRIRLRVADLRGHPPNRPNQAR